MSISTLFDSKNPFDAARREPLSPLWHKDVTYVLVRWNQGIACGQMTEDPTGARITLTGLNTPTAGTLLEVRVPRAAWNLAGRLDLRVTAVEPELTGASVWCAPAR